MLRALAIEQANTKTWAILLQMLCTASVAELLEKVKQTSSDTSSALVAKVVETSVMASMESLTAALAAALKPLGEAKGKAAKRLCFSVEKEGHLM